MERLMKAVERVGTEGFYLISKKAPHGKVFHNNKLDLYIMRPEMVESFLASMRAAGLEMIELEESDVSQALLPGEKFDDDQGDDQPEGSEEQTGELPGEGRDRP